MDILGGEFGVESVKECNAIADPFADVWEEELIVTPVKLPQILDWNCRLNVLCKLHAHLNLNRLNRIAFCPHLSISSH